MKSNALFLFAALVVSSMLNVPAVASGPANGVLCVASGGTNTLPTQAVDLTVASPKAGPQLSFVSGGKPNGDSYHRRLVAKGKTLKMQLDLIGPVLPIGHGIVLTLNPIYAPKIVSGSGVSILFNGTEVLPYTPDTNVSQRITFSISPEFINLNKINTISIQATTTPFLIGSLGVGQANVFLDLDQPAPPDTVARLQPDWDLFSWNTFVAMNWPATLPQMKNKYQRGFPNIHEDFASYSCKDNSCDEHPVVWETYKEKREMFLHQDHRPQNAQCTDPNDKSVIPDKWNSPFQYGADRTMYGPAKFATLDETVQVSSEALEPDSKFLHKAVVPRVFRGKPANFSPGDPGNAVRYEVKVNYDFYDYVMANQLYCDSVTHARAKQRPPVQLPWRTSRPDPQVLFLTQKPAVTPYVQGYSAIDTSADYANAKEGDVPPKIGSIHLKAAWVPITDKEAASGRYLWREATYFQGAKTPQPESAKFGLIGLHIIQRIKNGPGANGLLNSNPIGGTFIYSTWEHVDVDPVAYGQHNPVTGEVNPAYYYTNFHNQGGNFVPDKIWKVTRLYGERDKDYNAEFYGTLVTTQQVNAGVHAAIRAQNQDSVWLNYNLVGTQFIAADATEDINPTTEPVKAAAQNNCYGMPVFLANLMIETNRGLQHFQGLPPGAGPPHVTPTPSQFEELGYRDESNTKATFNNTLKFLRTTQSDHGASPHLSNLGYGYKGYNMGGCMGCHGVAQLQGYSFSFVLLGGQAGADPDTERHFLAPLSKPPQ